MCRARINQALLFQPKISPLIFFRGFSEHKMQPKNHKRAYRLLFRTHRKGSKVTKAMQLCLCILIIDFVYRTSVMI